MRNYKFFTLAALLAGSLFLKSGLVLAAGAPADYQDVIFDSSLSELMVKNSMLIRDYHVSQNSLGLFEKQYKQLQEQLSAIVAARLDDGLDDETPLEDSIEQELRAIEGKLNAAQAECLRLIQESDVVAWLISEKQRASDLLLVGQWEHNFAHSDQIIDEVPIEHAQPSFLGVRQADVVRQTEKAGGVASCGYHAVKNCLLIMDSQEDRMRDKHGLGVIAKLFGPGGTWRTVIVARRGGVALRYVMFKKMCQLLRQDPLLDEGIRSLYRNILQNFTREWSAQVIDGQEVEVDAHMLPAYIASVPLQKISDPTRYGLFNSQEELEDYIHNPETINRYLDLDASSICWKSQMIGNAITEYNRDMKARELDTIEQSGDWLDVDEVLLLATQNAREHFKENVTVIQDITSVDELDQFEIERVKEHLAQDDEYIHGFMLGTMSRARVTRGHWFCAVISKKENGIECVVADSACADRTQDARVIELLSRLGII